MAKKKKVEISTQQIEEEYLIHNEFEDDELFWLKEGLKNALTPYQRKIYITYIEAGTYAATAKAFKVSTPTAKKYIDKLTGIIMEYVFEHLK